MSEDGHRALREDIRVVGGSPDAVELAALTAVLGAALDGLASSSRRVADSAPSGWRRSQLGHRRPLPRGDWRHSGWL